MSATATEEESAWDEHVDPQSGKTYFVNVKTGESSWTGPNAKKGGGKFFLVALLVAACAAAACALPPDHAIREAVPFAWPYVDPASLSELRLVDVVPAGEKVMEILESVNPISTSSLPDATDVAGGGGVIVAERRPFVFRPRRASTERHRPVHV